MHKKIKLIETRINCRVCNSKELLKFLELGNMPLADLFVINPKKYEKKFPLNIAVCKKCFLVQLLNDVNDTLLFADNYAFYSGGSPASLRYFKEYAQDVLKRFPINAKKFTLEIASNDGTLLSYFKKAECKTLGIDPAKNVGKYANAKGIETLIDFFNDQSAKVIEKSYGKPKIIIANNVIAHVTNPYEFMKGVKNLLASDGVFIFECQYFPYLLFNNQFDNIYHEHRSFFSFSSLNYLINKVGLKAIDIEEHDTQGGSIRVFVTHINTKRLISSSIKKILKNEQEIGLFNIDTYTGFSSRVNYIKMKLLDILSKLKEEGKVIAGYGASAKSNTLLNYCKIDTKYLDFIVDKTPYKFGLYTPGTHIPVVEVPNKVPDYYLLLVWNYSATILQKEQKFRNNGGKFIIPIPTPSIL